MAVDSGAGEDPATDDAGSAAASAAAASSSSSSAAAAAKPDGERHQDEHNEGVSRMTPASARDAASSTGVGEAG